MKKLFLIFLFAASAFYAQEISDKLFTGNLNVDSQIAFERSEQVISDSAYAANKKTPMLAAGLSIAIPGAGQFYNKDFLLSAVFVAVEAAGIATAIAYNHKGDDQTAFFEAYALDNWAVDKYADWSYVNAQRINSSITDEQLNDFQIYNGDGSVNWTELNRLERTIGLGEGSWYSHQLAPYKEQQYFEMIGKYKQFNPGWADFSDPNNEFNFSDPLTKMFTDYSKMRGEANDYYAVAKTAVTILIVNHIVSALEAAWGAHRHNQRLKTRVSLESRNFGYVRIFYPQLNFRLTI
ncbi:MAG: hypothetical protein GXO87_06175 [Chlorobi bacterium]|nr:hypothetical protein [Chlorobiota bacterium]